MSIYACGNKTLKTYWKVWLWLDYYEFTYSVVVYPVSSTHTVHVSHLSLDESCYSLFLPV